MYCAGSLTRQVPRDQRTFSAAAMSGFAADHLMEAVLYSFAVNLVSEIQP